MSPVAEKGNVLLLMVCSLFREDLQFNVPWWIRQSYRKDVPTETPTRLALSTRAKLLSADALGHTD